MLNRLILFVFIVTMPAAAFSVDFKSLIDSEKSKNINIKSKSLVIKNNEDLAIFYDDVVVKQGNITLKADEIVVFTEATPEGKKKFKIIEAKDNVFFTASGKEATADKARYVIDDKLVSLSGNVELKEKGNMVKGDKFTYNVASGKSSIKSLNSDGSESKKTRVKAVITPGGDVDDVGVPIPPVQIFKPEEEDKFIRGSQ